MLHIQFLSVVGSCACPALYFHCKAKKSDLTGLSSRIEKASVNGGQITK